MAKKGMHRADNIYDKNKNRAEIVPELQGGLNLATKKPIRLLQAHSRRHKRCITVNRTAKDLFQIFILI